MAVIRLWRAVDSGNTEDERDADRGCTICELESLAEQSIFVGNSGDMSCNYLRNR